ncbi:MAG: arsenate reductase ArsC [Candidatus Thermoplasmatota archaeon]|nr:arsenate reductase ArsC [Candidatus Thermoplasmatota archaeon]
MKFLFVCVENAGRSKMAEAFALGMGLDATSAGTMPSAQVNPEVVRAMEEVGVPISEAKPRLMTMEMIDEADVVVTMGCSVEEVCPRPMLSKMQKKLIDWNLEDPKGKPVEKVREIRDEIRKKVSELRSYVA